MATPAPPLDTGYGKSIQFTYDRWVRVHFMKRGIHFYGASATDPTLATGDKYDVSYLAHPHAHDFWYQVDVEVFKNDRDIEFIQLRMWLEDQYDTNILQCGHKSVEMLAEELINIIASRYPGRRIKVGVYEDSLHANGGIVEYTPQQVY